MKECSCRKVYCKICWPETDEAERSQVERGVIPASVEERLEAYYIFFEDGGMYLQRKETTRATDDPLSFKEIVIIKLCETILGKQA